MGSELHVLLRGDHVATFPLATGKHVLGSGGEADFVLPADLAPSALCRIELDLDGHCHVRALAGAELTLPDGETTDRAGLANARSLEVGELQLMRLTRKDEPLVADALTPRGTRTLPSLGVQPPDFEPMALVVAGTRGQDIFELTQPEVVFGRIEGNDVAGIDLRFTHSEVSRRHARLIERADGWWLEDLRSANGTWLEGVRIQSTAIKAGQRFRLSRALDAPELTFLPFADAFAEQGADEAVAPLRGRSAAMKAVRSMVARYAGLAEPVLILGETGTGKELVARALAMGRGKKLPFIPVDCTALQSTLIESQLFGHVKHAFTGAAADRAGFFEQAKNGTLFLDEIGELPLEFQAKLLRALQEREVWRLGDNQPRPIAARFCAATHRDLGEMVKAGTFRQDLHFRLAVLTVRIPPLRRRLEDIPELARGMLSGLHGVGAHKSLSPKATERLLAHRWPGNVRELHNVLARAAIDSPGDEIAADAITFLSEVPAPVAEEPEAATAPLSAHEPLPPARPRSGDEGLTAYLKYVKQREIDWELAAHNGNRRAAARALGVDEATIRKKPDEPPKAGQEPPKA